MTAADTAGSPASPVAVPRGRRLGVALAVAAVIVALDVATKHWAVNALADQRPRHVGWTLQWNLSYNTGMAFSSGQGMGRVIGLLAVVIAVVVLRAVRTVDSRVAIVAGGLVAGGALGNVIDRLFRNDGWMSGAVIDFIDFQWFPIFNVADIAVNVGGGLFILWSVFGHHPTEEAAS